MTAPSAVDPLLPAARAEEPTTIFGAGEAEVVAVDHVDVAFHRGSFTAIVGPSGGA